MINRQRKLLKQFARLRDWNEGLLLLVPLTLMCHADIYEASKAMLSKFFIITRSKFPRVDR